MKISAHEEGKKELLLGRRTIAERIEAENIIIHAANFLPLLFHHPDGRTVFHRAWCYFYHRTNGRKKGHIAEALMLMHMVVGMVIFAKEEEKSERRKG